SSSGESRMAPVLARAAVAAGCDAVFLECHKEPGKSLSDRDTVLPLTAVPGLYSVLRKIDEVI
ncbi:MAG: 3-deoxy-8-phosphooctulonate synthase, partial [Verrucomicrobiota bacterium]